MLLPLLPTLLLFTTAAAGLLQLPPSQRSPLAGVHPACSTGGPQSPGNPSTALALTVLLTLLTLLLFTAAAR